jgi:hypothetical protein
MNFLEVNHEPTPYSDAHVCAPYNLTSKYVSHTERSQCVDFVHLCSPPESVLRTRNVFPLVHSDNPAMRFLVMNKHKRAHLSVMSVTQEPEKRLTIGMSEVSAKAAYVFFSFRASNSGHRTITFATHYLSLVELREQHQVLVRKQSKV